MGSTNARTHARTQNRNVLSLMLLYVGAEPGVSFWQKISLLSLDNWDTKCPDETTKEWRKLRGKDIHDFYSSLNIIRVSKLRKRKGTGYYAGEGQEKGIQYFSQKPQGKRLLGRPRHRRKHYMNTNLGHVIATLWTALNWLRTGPKDGHI